MIKIVLDTSVIIAGVLSQQGASHQILTRLITQEFINLMSVPLFMEYEAVLKRPNMIIKHGLNLNEIDILLSVLAKHSKKVHLHYLWRPQLHDPQDEMVLETAVNGIAKAIVTFNIKDFKPVENSFNLELWTPAQFLHYLRDTS